MRKIFFAGALMMAIGVSGAFAQSSMGSGGSDNKDSMKMSGKMAADSKFMMMAAMSDMNEIGLSNMALQKSSNEDVKKLAQMMVDDHTKASEELKSLAMSKNVTLPTDADAKHKMMMDKMNSMSGMDFDMMYVKAMVKDHEKAVKMFQKESMSGKDADAKAFAAKTLPTLQGHLTMAQSMSGKMKGGMKSGKMSGDKMSGM